MPVELKLGEFEEGKAKGFRYYYPHFTTIEDAVAFFGNEDITGISYLVNFINNHTKQSYSERVRLKNVPKLAGAQLRSYLENLAEQHPDGVLLSKDEALVLKPWKKITTIEQDILKMIEELPSMTPTEQVAVMDKVREKQAQLNALQKEEAKTV